MKTRKIQNPTSGVLKKRITENNIVLVSLTTGRVSKVGGKVWTPKGMFKIVGGARGKVFVSPVRKNKNPYVRAVDPKILDLAWIFTSAKRGESFAAY